MPVVRAAHHSQKSGIKEDFRNYRGNGWAKAL
jgi:hypothetical protein